MQTYGVTGIINNNDEKLQYRKILLMKNILSTYTKQYIQELIISLVEDNNIRELQQIAYYPMNDFNNLMQTKFKNINILEKTQNTTFSFLDAYFRVDKFNNNIYSINEANYIELLEEYMEWVAKTILENDCNIDEKLQKHKDKIMNM